MGRMVFKGSEFEEFILKVKSQLNLNWDDLGKSARVSGRTLRDWKRGVLLPSEKIVGNLEKLSGISAPKPIEIREEFWSGRKYGYIGALARMKKYGPPGTSEGRRKGGIVSQQRRKENPEHYKKLGCLVRKEFKYPKYSDKLAEFVGIVLGDGSISNYQIKITLNYKDDSEYAIYVKDLIGDLFGEFPTTMQREDAGCIDLMITGINLVEYCLSIGLLRGNKVTNQVDVPKWIKKKREYYLSCMRGLFDTDGCVYFHKHWSNGIRYRNLGFCFTNCSRPLLNFFYHGLCELSCQAYLKEKNVFMYSLEEIERFFKEVGPRNWKQTIRLRYHMSNPKRIS